MANYPDVLVKLWEQISPSLRTQSFEKQADRLRKEALLEQVPDDSDEDWENLEGVDSLRAFNNTIHYVLPKLLLVTTAFEVSAFGSENKSQPAANAPEIPLGVAQGTGKVEMLDPDKASDQVRGTIQIHQGTPWASFGFILFQGLGNWPDFLKQTWNRLYPIVGSPAYEAQKHKLITLSETMVQDMAVPQVDLMDLKEKEASEIKAILAAFRLKFIPEMLLDAVMIKALLDGSEEATSSPFSIT